MKFIKLLASKIFNMLVLFLRECAIFVIVMTAFLFLALSLGFIINLIFSIPISFDSCFASFLVLFVVSFITWGLSSIAIGFKRFIVDTYMESNQ